MILDHIRTRFLGGNLYVRATYMRVYAVGSCTSFLPLCQPCLTHAASMYKYYWEAGQLHYLLQCQWHRGAILYRQCHEIGQTWSLFSCVDTTGQLQLFLLLLFWPVDANTVDLAVLHCSLAASHFLSHGQTISKWRTPLTWLLSHVRYKIMSVFLNCENAWKISGYIIRISGPNSNFRTFQEEFQIFRNFRTTPRPANSTQTNQTYNKQTQTQNTASPLVYNNMGWLGDGSHRDQGCQAWTSVGLLVLVLTYLPFYTVRNDVARNYWTLHISAWRFEFDIY